MATATQANTRLTFRQLETLYIANGGSSKLAPVMAGIAMAESRGRVNAKHVNSNGSIDQGLWQINSSNSQLYRNQDIYDPNVNAKAAVRLAEHSGNGLRNWVTYKTGAYKRFVKIPKTPKQKAKQAGAGVFTPDNFVGTDQGVDFKGAGAIPALGSGVVTYVGSSSIIEGGRFPVVIYRLTDGPYKGQFVYVAENFVPSVKKGSRVVAGQTIGRALGKFPYIEVGFNKTASGWNPQAPLDPTNPHASTPAGSTMWNYIQGVTGLKKGGGGGFIGTVEGIPGDVGGAISGGASAVWNFNPFSAAGSAIGDATGIHPERWVKEALTILVDAFAIAGGGFIFVFGFVLIAADIGLSSRAGRVAAAVPAGRYIARGARSQVSNRTSRASSRTSKPSKHIGPSETGSQPRTRKVVHVYRDETSAERVRRMSGKNRSRQNQDDIPF